MDFNFLFKSFQIGGVLAQRRIPLEGLVWDAQWSVYGRWKFGKYDDANLFRSISAESGMKVQGLDHTIFTIQNSSTAQNKLRHSDEKYLSIIFTCSQKHVSPFETFDKWNNNKPERNDIHFLSEPTHTHPQVIPRTRPKFMLQTYSATFHACSKFASKAL